MSMRPLYWPVVRFAAIFALALASPPASAQATRPDIAEAMWRLGSRGIRAHDPSTIIECAGEYWLFATGPGIRSYHAHDDFNVFVNWGLCCRGVRSTYEIRGTLAIRPLRWSGDGWPAVGENSN